MIGWGQWRIEPVLAGAIVFLGWIYAMAAGPLRGRLAPGEPFPRACAARFYAALALFFLVVESPFGALAHGYLFSADMVQVLVIIYPVAGLALLGIPPWMVDGALNRHEVERTVPRTLSGRATAGFILRAPICGAVFVMVVTGWHLPRLFEWGLENGAAHALEHASLFLAAILFWWPLASPSRLFRPLGFAGRMLYLFAIEVALTALFTYLLMADHAIYPSYQYAPRVFPWLDAVDDQVLAGVLLSAVSSFVLVAVLGAAFFRWHREHEESGK